nr:DUF2202 domain-containing protein [uncultured Desulfobulbus sp.]
MNLVQRIEILVCISLITTSLSLVDQSWAGNKRQQVVTPLSEAEASTLRYMREEEQLARDVYTQLYEAWGAVLHANIATSEQRHTDAIKTKLDKYGLEDPASGQEGRYSLADLTELYTNLIDRGSDSLVEAFIVGCIIEDLDIADLNDAIDENTHLDLKITYENLRHGSKNHLRAFVAALESLGGIYEPQYISQEEFNAILD